MALRTKKRTLLWPRARIYTSCFCTPASLLSPLSHSLFLLFPFFSFSLSPPFLFLSFLAPPYSVPGRNGTSNWNRPGVRPVAEGKREISPRPGCEKRTRIRKRDARIAGGRHRSKEWRRFVDRIRTRLFLDFSSFGRFSITSFDVFDRFIPLPRVPPRTGVFHFCQVDNDLEALCNDHVQ